MGMLSPILERHVRPQVKRDAERRSEACTIDPLREDESLKYTDWAGNGQGGWAPGLWKVESTALGG